MADAMDLESIGQPCRFKSYYPHQKKKYDFRTSFSTSNLSKFDYNVATATTIRAVGELSFLR